MAQRPFRTASDAATVPGVGERQAGAVREFLALLDRMRGRFGPGSLAGPAEELVRALGLEEAVRHSVKDPVAGERKVENVREVVAALASFEHAEPGTGLGEYLAGVNLAGREEEPGEGGGDVVTLMTMHAAKGLEFPHVFLAGMEEGLLPHRRSEFETGGLEEERRLTYVGMTRARSSLTLTHAASRTKWSKEEKRTPSRFLDELPDEGVRREDRRSPGTADDGDTPRSAEAFFRHMRHSL